MAMGTPTSAILPTVPRAEMIVVPNMPRDLCNE